MNKTKHNRICVLDSTTRTQLKLPFKAQNVNAKVSKLHKYDFTQCQIHNNCKTLNF